MYEDSQAEHEVKPYLFAWGVKLESVELSLAAALLETQILGIVDHESRSEAYCFFVHT